MEDRVPFEFEQAVAKARAASIAAVEQARRAAEEQAKQRLTREFMQADLRYLEKQGEHEQAIGMYAREALRLMDERDEAIRLLREIVPVWHDHESLCPIDCVMVEVEHFLESTPE